MSHPNIQSPIPNPQPYLSETLGELSLSCALMDYFHKERFGWAGHAPSDFPRFPDGLVHIEPVIDAGLGSFSMQSEVTLINTEPQREMLWSKVRHTKARFLSLKVKHQTEWLPATQAEAAIVASALKHVRENLPETVSPPEIAQVTPPRQSWLRRVRASLALKA